MEVSGVQCRETVESLKGEASESPVVHAPYYPKVSY